MSTDDQKRAAATRAAGLVENGMVVGLGTGTTAEKLVEALGVRLQSEGLRFTGVPTSEATAAQARALGIQLTRLDDVPELDLTIDGADEVDPDLDLIKGHGGALTREKLVASAAKRFIVVVDEGKLVDRLGRNMPIPIEVVPFGWTTTRRRLETVGFACDLRGGEKPYVTDNGNYILDSRLTDGSRSYRDVADQIKVQTGVVEHGLFLRLARLVVVGKADGAVDVLGH